MKNIKSLIKPVSHVELRRTEINVNEGSILFKLI